MKIIQHHLNFRPDADWIKNQSGLPYLRLNISVPVTEIFQEWEKVKSLAVYHRASESMSEKFFYGHRDWKSLTIYGTHHLVTEHVPGTRSWTEVADKCPITKQWIEDNFQVDSSTGRIRFMLLEPGGYILPHTDRDHKQLSEVNIAVTNPSGCCLRFKNYGNVPFTPNSAFLMDTSNQHLVYNGSDTPRLHIIVHGQLKDDSVITQSYEDRYNN